MFKRKFEVKKSVQINTTKEKLWEYLTIPEKRNLWSPRYILDSKVEIKIEWWEFKKWFKESWNSLIIWEWEELILSVTKNKLIHSEVNIIKPYKNKMEAFFLIEDNKEWWLKFVWVIKWKVPFFAKSWVESMIWKDLERWLKMLKVLAETWVLNTKTEFIGTEEIESLFYVGNKWAWDLHHLLTNLKDDFSELKNLLEENECKPLWYFTHFSIYDYENDSFDYENSVSVSREDYDKLLWLLDLNHTIWELESMKVAKVSHIWSYNFIHNSIISSNIHLKPNKLKKITKLSPIFVYDKWPQDSDLSKDYKTNILVPIK